ncbi:MAG TPA: hypothetical protein VHW26_03045 [Solirubrobacteraceae bacterium]|nr:hypothetical protein [Solirubrobacteraceae bacterium]
MRIRLAGLTATLVTGCVLAGCGSSETADTAKIKRVVTSELADLAAGKGGAACALATPLGQAQLASGSSAHTCSAAIDEVSAHLSAAIKDGLRTAQVNKVTITGGSATVSDADITSTQGSLRGFLNPASAPTVLTKQPDGSWEIAG